MRFLSCIVCAFFVSMSFVARAHAHVPELIDQTSLHDITVIAEPARSQVFYGTLTGFPHTYEIESTERFTLHTEVLMPDIPGSQNNVSGLIIKQVPGSGRVEEVVRIHARDASWETRYEPWGGDTYRVGGSFSQELEPGVYRIEMSTPENKAKYALVVGTEESWEGVGYFELVRRIYGVKMFFEKSPIRIFESLIVSGPILFLGMIVGVFWWRRKRAQAVRE